MRNSMNNVAPTEEFNIALRLLLYHAKNDTGGSARCASFLLSLWNGNQFKSDVQDLLYVDTHVHEAMLIVFHQLHERYHQLDTYIKEAQMVPIIEMWGGTFRYPNHRRG